MCMLEAKYYLALNLCTASDPNSNLLCREMDVYGWSRQKVFYLDSQGQKHISMFLAISLQCFSLKVKFIGKFSFKDITETFRL